MSSNTDDTRKDGRPTSAGGRKPAQNKARRPSGGNQPKPSLNAGTESSMHAPKNQRKVTPDARSPSAQVASPSTPLTSPGSGLNPNAGGFHPGGLSSLPEVQHEALNSEFAVPVFRQLTCAGSPHSWQL
jgi:hypothetical protein